MCPQSNPIQTICIRWNLNQIDPEHLDHQDSDNQEADFYDYRL